MNDNQLAPFRHSAQFGTQHHGWLAKLSLEHKLPLIIATLLVAVIATISAAAYVEMRATSLRVASERLLSVTGQFRDLFNQSATQLRTNIATMAANDAIVRFAHARDARNRAAALAELSKGSQPEQIVVTELRDAAGNLLLSTHPDRSAAPLQIGDVLRQAQGSDSARIGRYQVVRDTTVYPVAVAVRGTKDVYLVRWRRMAGTQRTRETMNRLVGSDAAIFIGNADGSHWSDLERRVAALPVVAGGARPIQSYRRGADSARYLGATATIAGTPWAVAIDFPLRGVLAPLSRFMRDIALLAGVAFLLALIAGWVVSRRITVPLVELTEAASAISAGDFSRRVRIKRSDELGRLGRAFTIMEEELQQARTELERRVDARTADLNETLQQLHDAQDTLVRKEKLAMLGQLSSGVGHELRNPLGVMTNAVYFLKTVLAQQPPVVHDYLGILSQQIALSEKIVGDLLDFARSKPPRRAPTPLAEVTQAQIERIGKTDGVTIRNEVGSQLPPVLVDPVQLGQILLNLLTNASQAMDGKGTLTIRARDNGSSVTFEVSDTGPGVTPENLEKIFEPLFTTKARGIGLGLAVSRQLARANGGDLTVESVPGKGATFRLSLLAADERPAASPARTREGALV